MNEEQNILLILHRDGKLLSAGMNQFGCLGLGDEMLDTDGAPYEITLKKKTKVKQEFKEISVGKNHCLALAKNGAVWAWGDNTLG